MKITDIKVAVIANSPVVRIVTDAGISGYGQVESTKPYRKPHILVYKDYLIGEDPTNVERCMMKIRRMGSFKPWGSAVSAIEFALWDIAGKAANLPVYKLMGGKVRDHVRCYNGAVFVERTGTEPKDFHDWAVKIKALEQGFTIIKTAVGFHGGMANTPGFYYGNVTPSASKKDVGRRGPMTEYGLKTIVERVAAIKEGLGDSVGLALDCGPGNMLADAIRLANALEPFNLMWMEDLLTGDYTPYVMADDYLELTRSTTVPIHTGEQIYLRQNFRELIEKNAVRIVGPDPEDVGGIGELKWIAEYADLHGIQMAPHGVFDGLIGLAAHVQVGAAMPENYIAFEYPSPREKWWYDIIEGLPNPIVKNGLIEVWDRPGLGVEFNVKAAKQYLAEEDKNFFD
ncbi:MAG: mandelate racemase/muconate lactonizing enzyme family protein [Bacteroidetes bacterium]|nr:mandelate racemase/muconate lactonizing enzyme family protein [Bacteroidota bacterium]